MPHPLRLTPDFCINISLNAYPPALEKFKKRISWDNLNKELVYKHLSICIEEDLGTVSNSSFVRFDLSTNASKISNSGSAKLVAREPMIICGLSLIPMICDAFGTNSVTYESKFKDSDFIEADKLIAKLHGPVSEILVIERSILNFLQKLSGIATKTKTFVEKIKEFEVGLLDTRKTTPGLRMLEKYATCCGGGYNHRIGLYDRILIKDNHIAASAATSGSRLKAFLSRIVEENKSALIIEVEIDNLSQLQPALDSRVDAILLDNFSPDEIKEAVQKNSNQVVLEASGGITEDTIIDYAKAKPHFISSGAPIHSSRWLDIGLDWN